MPQPASSQPTPSQPAPSQPAPSQPTPSQPTPPASTVVDHLVDLVEVLDAAFSSHDDGVIVKVRGLGDTGCDIDAILLPSHEVYDELLGAEFPPYCDAAAVVVRGRARSMGDDIHEVGDILGPVGVVYAVSRDGASASSLRIDDDDPMIVTGGGDECVGRLADAVRRGFGLPTASPEHDVAALGWHVWLHRIHVKAVEGETITTGVIDDLRPQVASSWSELRRQCVQGGLPEVNIHPELAEWMDDGIFSRACLEAFPEVLDVMIELAELIDRDVWEHLVDGLARVYS